MANRGRIGLQPVGVDKADSAFPKELMINYKTGQVYISDINKVVISSDEIHRTKDHLNRFKNSSMYNNIYNDIYEIFTDKYTTPNVVDNNENILDTEIELPLYKKCFIGIDLDILINNKRYTELCEDRFLDVEVIFKVIYTDKSSEELSTINTLEKLNKYPIEIKCDKEISNLYISSIKFKENVSTIDVYRIILYSVLITGK